MASASFPNRPFNLRTNVWLIGQEVANNRSLVGWELWIDKRSYSPTYSDGIAARWMTINGVYVHNYGGNGFDFRNGNNFLLASGTYYVGHNADGTGGMSIGSAASFAILGSTSTSEYIGLPTIPRASSPVWAVQETKYMGSTYQINLNPASPGFTHDLYWYFGTKYGTIATGVGASTNWTVPTDITDQIPNVATGNGTIRAITFSGGVQIGYRDSTMLLTAPLSAVPTLDDINTSEATPGLAANVGAYVKGISTLALEIIGEAGAASSTITGRKLEIMSGATVLQTINADSGLSTPVNAAGTVAIKATVTDSRGRTASLTKNITVLDWNPPSLTSVSVKRALSNGTIDEDEGTYFRVDINAAISSLMNGTERNSMGYRVSTRAYGGTTWTLKDSGTLPGTVFNGYRTTGQFELTEAYEVLIEVYDEFVTSQVIIAVSVAAIFMHWDGSIGVGIGKFREDGRVDVAGDIYLREDSSLGEKGVLIPSPTGHAVISDRLPHSGTTAERDDYYGVPATASARAALANRKVTWFNTDLGWFESYYATTGTTGLTALGLVAGVPAAWYPLGPAGPEIMRTASTGAVATSGSVIGGWNTIVRNRGGSAWFDENTPAYSAGQFIRPKVPGYYDVEVNLVTTNGSGTGNFWLSHYNAAGNTYLKQRGYPVVLAASFFESRIMAFRNRLMLADEFIGVVCASGSLSVHVGASAYDDRGQFTLRYVGPALVNN